MNNILKDFYIGKSSDGTVEICMDKKGIFEKFTINDENILKDEEKLCYNIVESVNKVLAEYDADLINYTNSVAQNLYESYYGGSIAKQKTNPISSLYGNSWGLGKQNPDDPKNKN